MSYDSRTSQREVRISDGTGSSRPPLGPRERIVRSAAQLIRRQGVSGTGMREIVADADAPWGSLRHYFPEGKDQLVAEALLYMGGVAGRQAERTLRSNEESTPGQFFAQIVKVWRDEFLSSGYGAGCPLVAAAADVSGNNDELRGVIAQAFEYWQEPLAAALENRGVSAERSAPLAVLAISALEGAIVLARIRQEVEPLDVIVDELAPLLDAATGHHKDHLGG
jgi:AcrR family transcriptional regulator